MPPLPKRKPSKARQGDSRAHLALKIGHLAECPQCHQRCLPHRACPNCGYYRHLSVLKLKTKEKKK